MKLCIIVPLTWLYSVLVITQQSNQQPVNCQWGEYGSWSECDGCTKTQTRTRAVQVFAQFGGASCSGEAMQTRTCMSTRGCPLEADCSGRFRCQSGKCISLALVCNGDQDCEEDGLDEQLCDASISRTVCDEHKTPPNVELTGKGFDILTGQLKGVVINTKSFGGQCRKVFSRDHRTFYRLPLSLLGYTFQVQVDSDFTEEFYNSSWSYMKHVDNRQTFKGGHSYQTFHKELFKEKAHRMMIIKNLVEVVQFQNSPPQYLPLSEEFWKSLSSLPIVYDYEAYRRLLQTYGTHFLSEGSLGGEYQVLLQFDSEAFRETSTTDIDYHKCVTHVKRRLFRKKTTTKCDKIVNHLKTTEAFSNSKFPVKTTIIGGNPAFVAGLGVLDLEDPGVNMNMYSKWAGSVRSFPSIIKAKQSPLYELVKEVPCAALKKLHLKKAMQMYLEAEHPCHCRPCQNNGQPLLEGTSCTCICRPDTSGQACGQGAVIGEPPGVVHGAWSCWSSWNSCSRGYSMRTRSCTNPPPSMGGQHCLGESSDQRPCEDPDLQHLRVMEPHCFDPAVIPMRSCKPPPALRNGFVLDPKDVYPVGSKVQYACIEGYHLLGDRVAECTEKQIWNLQQTECRGTVCLAPTLSPDVMGEPWKVTYEIGERLSLSCPPETQREGPSQISCDSSLNWTPLPTDTKCRAVATNLPKKPRVTCEVWEKLSRDHCVCKLPYECGSSLEVCATNLERGHTDRLSVCKIGALKCLGRSYTLAEESSCDWPKSRAMPCSACQLWEKCDEHTHTCVCRKLEECSDHGARVCVQPTGSTAAMTMTECEAGLRRCRGEQLSIVGISPCSS